MYYETIFVANEDVKYFMDEVKPRAKFKVEDDDGCNMAFEFTSYADWSKAQKWIYGKYDFTVDVEGKIIGSIYYYKGSGYCFVCDIDGHEEFNFVSPYKAEDALLEYYYSNKGVA